MIRNRYLGMALALTACLFAGGWLVTNLAAQSTGGQKPAQVTPDQQKQLDQLTQLESQLQEDRMALQEAITRYGWDSEQVDAAQGQLTQDRIEYRKLRRSLQQAGVMVPPVAAVSAGGMGPRRGMRAGHMGCGHHAQQARHGCADCPHEGHRHHGCEGCADCPGCGM